MTDQPTGCVYFVQAAEVGLVKIGFSARNPNSRLIDLQAGSPVPLKPLGMIPGPRDLETAMHRRFAHLRERFEWFQPGVDLLDFIREHTSPWPNDDDGPPAAGLPRLYEIRGERRTLQGWAEHYGLPCGKLRRLVSQGTGIEGAIMLARLRRRDTIGRAVDQLA